MPGRQSSAPVERTRSDRYISAPGRRCPSAGAYNPERRERSMYVLARLDEARGAINVLEHPFYQRWTAGELSAEELSCYAGEYRHAVSALAEASSRAAEAADLTHRAGL